RVYGSGRPCLLGLPKLVELSAWNCGTSERKRLRIQGPTASSVRSTESRRPEPERRTQRCAGVPPGADCARGKPRQCASKPCIDDGQGPVASKDGRYHPS